MGDNRVCKIKKTVGRQERTIVSLDQEVPIQVVVGENILFLMAKLVTCKANNKIRKAATVCDCCFLVATPIAWRLIFVW